MEEMNRGDSDGDSDEHSEEDLDDEKTGTRKKSAYRRRGRHKDKYVCKFDACGQTIKVDHCLCARLILASSLGLIILGMFYTLWSMDAQLKEDKNS